MLGLVLFTKNALKSARRLIPQQHQLAAHLDYIIKSLWDICGHDDISRIDDFIIIMCQRANGRRTKISHIVDQTIDKVDGSVVSAGVSPWLINLSEKS